MKLDLSIVSDAVLLDVLNDVAPFGVQRTGETRDAYGAKAIVDGTIEFYADNTMTETFTVHRLLILNIQPLP